MDSTSLTAITAALGAVITAVATIALWRVTAVLAQETSRLADSAGQPQIVATLRVNRWTMLYADLVVTNSGNASAFSIKIEFSPPLIIEQEDGRKFRDVPFQSITVMRPGESFSSDVGKAFPMLEKEYIVTTSWLRDPKSTTREYLSYSLSFGDFKDVRQLGATDPLVQIADEVKHIREDWRQVASGNRNIRTDVFTSLDRIRSRREHERSWRRQQREAEAAEHATPTASSDPSDT